MNLTPELEQEFDKLRTQLRGYELAREEEDGSWTPVIKYRTNPAALDQAIAAGRYLEWSSKKRGYPETYRVRAILSVDVGLSDPPRLPVPEEALVAPEELESMTAQETDDESLIIKPDSNEFAGEGFKVKGHAKAIPFDYASQAAQMELNFDPL